MSAYNGSRTLLMKKDREQLSTSPNKKTSQHHSFNTLEVSKKLGGPQTPVTNTMNFASREKRERLFFHEHEAELLNKLGPGPAKYETLQMNSHVRPPQFSIPVVS